MSATLFVPNLHNSCMIMTEQDSWHIIVFPILTPRAPHPVFFCLAYTLTYNGLYGQSADETATHSGCLYTSLTQQGLLLTKFPNTMQYHPVHF